MTTKMTRVFQQLMKEMFKRVGLKYDPDYCFQEDWYLTKSWTEAEQRDFKLWGEGILKSKLQMTDHGAAREMGWFLLSYGWTTVRGDNENKN